MSSPVELAIDVVDEQSNDDGLWFNPKYATERFLQDALRRLHAAVEGVPVPESVVEILEAHRAWKSRQAERDAEIRTKTIEECAKVADGYCTSDGSDMWTGGNASGIARDIRSLATKPGGET